MQADELAGKDGELALSGDFNEGKNIQPTDDHGFQPVPPSTNRHLALLLLHLEVQVVIKVTQVVARVTAQLPHEIVRCAAYGSSLAVYHHLLPTFRLKRHFADTSFLPATLPRT